MRKKDIFKAILINRSERQLFDIFQPVDKKIISTLFYKFFNEIIGFNLLPDKFYDKYLIVRNTWPAINPP